MDKMDQFDEIKDAIENVSNNDDESTDTKPNEEQITVTSTNPISILRRQMATVMAENAEIKKMFKDLTGKITPLIINMSGDRPRNKGKIPSSDLFTMEPRERFSSRDVSRGMASDVGSTVSVHKPESMFSNISSNVNEFINPFKPQPLTPCQNLSAGPAMYKSNIVTASKGYNNRKQLWGTALGSFLIAASKYYIEKTGKTSLMITEEEVISKGIWIAPTLNSIARHANLPDSKAPTTIYLADMISRVDKKDIPLTDAATWYGITECQDGKDIVHILETIITMAQLVPEILPHPVSQISSFLVRPMLRTRPAEVDGNKVMQPFFAMQVRGDVKMLPGPWERWCSKLKEPALAKYIRYRLTNMKEHEVVAIMLREIPKSQGDPDREPDGC